MLSIANRNTIDSQRVGGGFSIKNSFLLDGVDEFFTLGTQANWTDYTAGSKKFSTFFVIKRGNTGGALVTSLAGQYGAAGSRSFRFTIFNDMLNMGVFDSANSGGFMNGTTALTSTAVWYGIAYTYDPTQSLGSRGKIYLNAVEETLAGDTLKADAKILAEPVFIGKTNVSTFGNYNLSSGGLVNRIATQSEITNWYNGGKPKSLIDVFGVDCKDFINPDTSGSTAQFTMNDGVNPATWVSTNLEDADKTTDTPY